MTVIDQLVVLLGLDASKFKSEHKASQEAMKKTGEAAKKQNAEVQASIARVAEGYRAVRTELLGLLGVALSSGGIGRFVAKMTEGDVATGNTAKNIDMSTKRLAAWQSMFRTFGGSTEGIAGAFKQLAKFAFDMKEYGNSEMLAPLEMAFQRAGMSLAKFANKATTTEERMRMIFDVANKLSATDAQGFLQAAGFDEQTITTMRLINEQRERALELALRTNAASERDLELARERLKLRTNFWEKVEGKTRSGVSTVTDGILGLESYATKRSSQMPKGSPIGYLLKRFFGIDIDGAGSGSAGFGTAATEDRGWNPLAASSAPRGMRNNNPGNLNFVGQEGATLEPGGRFAQFRSIVDGLRALDRQLGLYSMRGKKTIAEIISTYAPSNENNTAAYISSVSRSMLADPNQPLDLNDPKVRAKLMRAITNVEVGPGWVSMRQIEDAVSSSRQAGRTEVTINGGITVNTAATDAAGVARDLRGELSRQMNMVASSTSSVD